MGSVMVAQVVLSLNNRAHALMHHYTKDASKWRIIKTTSKLLLSLYKTVPRMLIALNSNLDTLYKSRFCQYRWE